LPDKEVLVSHELRAATSRRNSSVKSILSNLALVATFIITGLGSAMAGLAARRDGEGCMSGYPARP
jgi:hypothetical protein